jgi:hypothetical protein
MPDVISARRPPIGDVSNLPVNLLGVGSQSLFRGFECRCGNVENCEIRPATPQKLVNQIGRAAAYVD